MDLEKRNRQKRATRKFLSLRAGMPNIAVQSYFAMRGCFLDIIHEFYLTK